MRRIAVTLLVFTLATPAFAVTRTREEGRFSPILRVLRLIAHAFGDEMVEPKP